MKEKIKTLIYKIKLRYKQSQCYNLMERKGVAVFSMCCGKTYKDMRLPRYAKGCTICPYFTPVDESLKVESEVDTE